MNLKAQRAALVKAAQAVIAKARSEERDLTDEEVADLQSKQSEIEDLTDKIEKAEKSSQLIAQLTGADSTTFADDTGHDPDGGKDTDEPRTFGERFTGSKAYTGFAKQHPTGVGQGSIVDIGKVKVGSLGEWYDRQAGGAKADVIGSPTARLAPARYPTVNTVDRDRLTLLDLVTRGQAAGAFEYVQITSVTRRAAIVPEATADDDAAALKPVSEFATQLADAKPYTYADGYVVTNQMLSDAPALATYLNSEVGYSLDSVIEDKLLNGTGTNGEPRGILNTTGVQQREYTAAAGDAMPLVKSVRQGITDVTRTPGGTVTAVMVSPEDDEMIDLMQDAQDRFYGQGPFGSGPGTLWGRPRVTSERLAAGQYILGDFRQVALLDVEGLSILAFNQHRDFAQRNLTYVRAELRAEQVIWKPARLVNGQSAA
jgi:HK97 family phage major capsid protein